jgi:hypothetical protein
MVIAVTEAAMATERKSRMVALATEHRGVWASEDAYLVRVNPESEL